MNARSKSPTVETTFRALPDRTRLRILSLLRGGELCVCDLVTVLNVPQPTASRHLAYLRRTGFVAARRDGPWMHYRLLRGGSGFRRKLLECLELCCGEEPVFQRDAKRLQSGRYTQCSG